MISVLRSIASLFLPQRIVIVDLFVTVKFLGEVESRQDISQLIGFTFHRSNPFTGGKMLSVRTEDYVACDYFGQQIGFSKLLQQVIAQSDLSQEVLDSFSHTGIPPDGFSWRKE